ncbi:MAG: serine hydrolase domain-containing protein [Candidatus Margulisiibacteriota bacterium]
MKKNIVYLFAAGMILAFFVAGCGNVDDNPQLQSDLNNLVSTQWLSYLSQYPTVEGGVAVFVLTPKGDFFACASMESGTSSTTTHFRGASTTKTFTAASIMLLSQQGKLNIDDKITDLIPGSSEAYVPNTVGYAIPYKDQITIKLILRHRAGIWDISNSAIPSTAETEYKGQNYISYIEASDRSHTFTFDELLGVVATNELCYFAPDADYHYSDTGYSLLGKIVERVSGKSYGQFVADNFVTPNNLTASSFPSTGADQTIPSPFAAGHSLIGGVLYNTTEDNMSPHVAEGNLITTASNLGNWLRGLLNGNAGLNSATIAQMEAQAAVGVYGLGLSYLSGLGYGHDGAHPGYSSVVRHNPTQNVTVVVYSNFLTYDSSTAWFNYLHDLGRAAKNVLGYSTAEAN